MSMKSFDVIGAGGMGIVLKAFDPHLNRIVAIKVLHPELAVSRQCPEAVWAGSASCGSRERRPRGYRLCGERGGQTALHCHGVRRSGASLQEVIDAEGPLDLKKDLARGDAVF